MANGVRGLSLRSSASALPSAKGEGSPQVGSTLRGKEKVLTYLPQPPSLAGRGLRGLSYARRG